MVVFKGVTEAMAALEGGNCIGTVFDTTYFAGLDDAKWASYAMVLPSIDPEPWGMGSRKEDAKFTAFLTDPIISLNSLETFFYIIVIILN